LEVKEEHTEYQQNYFVIPSSLGTSTARLTPIILAAQEAEIRRIAV
jgi:hypothetical protein